MLTLTRKVGQRIKVGEDIWVTVVGVEAGKLRVGIEAPPWVKIVREELLPPGERKEVPSGPAE